VIIYLNWNMSRILVKRGEERPFGARGVPVVACEHFVVAGCKSVCAITLRRWMGLPLNLWLNTLKKSHCATGATTGTKLPTLDAEAMSS
jgi:hypothetical protein